MAIDKNLEKIQRLLGVLDEDQLTKKDFVESFGKVVDLVLKIQERQERAIQQLFAEHARLAGERKQEYDSNFKDLRGQVNDLFVGDQLKRMEGETKTNFQKLQGLINETINKKLGDVDSRMSEVKDGGPGPKGDQGIPGPMPKEHLELMKEMRDEMKKVQSILSNIPRGKAMGRAKTQVTRRVDLTSQVDGNTRSFTLPPDTVAVLGIQGSQFPFTIADVYISLRGNVMTLGDQVATPAAGQTLVALLDVLFYP